MVKRQEHSNAKGDRATRGIDRDLLLTAAAELFADNGYRATTLDDIAHVLDIKKASLYHYISSKDDLLTEIYERIFRKIQGVTEPISMLELPADERLRRMILAHVEVVVSERDMLAVAFREEAELAPVNQRRIRQRKREYERLFERVLEEGQADGLVRSGSALIMARGLLGMCNWLYQWYEPSRFAAAEIAAEFAAMVESGVLSADPRETPLTARFANLDEAFEAPEALVDELSDRLTTLRHELDDVKERLSQGLAGDDRRG